MDWWKDVFKWIVIAIVVVVVVVLCVFFWPVIAAAAATVWAALPAWLATAVTAVGSYIAEHWAAILVYGALAVGGALLFKEYVAGDSTPIAQSSWTGDSVPNYLGDPTGASGAGAPVDTDVSGWTEVGSTSGSGSGGGSAGSSTGTDTSSGGSTSNPIVVPSSDHTALAVAVAAVAAVTLVMAQRGQ